MLEIVGTFTRAKLRNERANCSSKAWNGSRGDLAEKRLEFAVGHLDRIEIRGIFRQIAHARPHFLNCIANGGGQMDSAVVHDDNVIAPKRGDQTLLDIGQEHLRSWHLRLPSGRSFYYGARRPRR